MAKLSPEECYVRAIEISNRQKARSLELRAVVSLLRLRQGKTSKRKTFSMLKEVYDWFTEGFETPDLKEARNLIEEMS
jgi:predicted ATPase